ncbi:MAG TPA: NfeD family protein, partial [Solirubrobacteraceae bacterium]
MSGWVFWVIAAVVLAVGEMLTMGFFLAPFAGGGLVAALVSAGGGGVVLAWIAFIVVSLLLLLVVRPIARSHRRMPAAIRTGTAALIGRRGIVVERIA